MNKKVAYFAALSFLSFSAAAETTTVDYSGRSGIAPVASSRITTQINGSNYTAAFDGKGIGIAAVTQYRIKADSKGITGNTTKPSYAHLWSSRKGKARDTKMTFSGSRPQITITPHWTPGSSKEKLNPSHLNDSIDVMTTLIRLSNQVRLKGSCYGTFNVTDGRSALQVTAQSGGKQNVSTKAYKGQATLCKLRVKPLSGRVLRDAETNSTQNVNVYFANIKGKEYPVAVRVTGRFAGFGVSLEADSIK